MSVEIVMPQMGESITEGTISKWLKKVGETIGKDENILEISTDKVDAEVPSSAAGVLLEIRHLEGETVEVGTVVAVVGSAGEISSPKSQVPGPIVFEKPKVEQVTQEVVETLGIIEEIKPVEIPRAAPTALAATEIVMPQMGESITEGTISKWLKKVGDSVEKDENILEISTDKVDAEVPSLAGGTLLEIRHLEGETVEVGTVLALVGAPGSELEVQTSPTTDLPKSEPLIVGAKAIAATAASSFEVTGNDRQSLEYLRKTKSSPLVRNIAHEHGIDLSRIAGSGMSGRVTKNDILSFLDSGAALKPQDLLIKPMVNSQALQPGSTGLPGSVPSPTAVALPVSITDRIEPMSNMRKRIAENMVISRRTSAHVTSVYEIDMTGVVKFREKNKTAFTERFGTKLTFMPFIFQAITQGLRKFPVINAQVSDDKIIYKSDINLGMAVALDWGLIVPVIKKADTLSISGLTLAANDLAERARTKKLKPDEVQGGTFTITNTGTFGGLFGTPIINQPQVAILCVGTIEKRPKVLTTPDGDDYIAIRSMAYFALTYDHRIVDGAEAERFLAFLKEYLETTQFSL